MFSVVAGPGRSILCAGACRQPATGFAGSPRRGAGPREQTAEQLWNKANTAYINGDFHAAADAYEELLSRGVSSMKLYYNLGNAYFKDDRIGKAILYYNRRCALRRATTTSVTT